MENNTKIVRLKELKQRLIAKFGDNIVYVILFGSQATGKATEFSDYDILIVLKDKYTWKLENEIINLCADFQIDYEIYLDTIIISLSEIQTSLRGKQPIIANTLKHGIYV